MRAQCEACGKAQPPDWKAGDLCSFCGQSVRHDVRCYWCAKWVPAAKFCRSCGAAVVEERLYGAARMLKDAGTDRFTIPKQLKDFDPDQIENFSRIYQRHAIAVARHVDEVRFLERFLRQKVWSAALEDELIPQLPWNEEVLASMSAPPPPPGDDLARVKAIQETTPFGSTQELARIARLRLEDWSAYKDVGSTFHSSDPAIRLEAALALSSWRVWSTYGIPRDLRNELYKELEKSTFKLEAAVRLALMGTQNADLLKEALGSADRETSFAAALVLGEVDRLQAALKGDELERVAAGRKLIELGILKEVVKTVEKSPLEVQQELVASLVNRKEAAPEAEAMLLEIVETTKDDTLRERAVRILCRRLRPEWISRIARKAGKERHIFQSMLQAPDLTPEGAQELGEFLIEKGHFTMGQYGLSSVAENGRMPDTFVPAKFAKASPETQGELLRFAEVQLEHRKNEDLHRFLMNVAFGPHPAKIRAAAWWSLHRWYRHLGEHRGEGPFKLQKDLIKKYFGSVRAFLPKLSAVLRDHDTLKEVGYYEMIANLLGSSDDDCIAAFLKEESAADELVAALLESMKGDYWPNTLESMVKLLSRIGTHDRWRTRVLKEIRGLGKKGNYHYDKAVRRLELSEYGIPEESEWDQVPLDFAAKRFPKADADGQRELLKLVEHQLIHKKTEEPDPGLARLLLDVALRPGDAKIRCEAMEMRADRIRGHCFPLRKKDVEEAYGSFSKFLPLVADLLTDDEVLQDSRFLEFLSELFEEPKPADAAALAAEGKAGLALIRGMLEFAGAAAGESNQINVRRRILRYLEKAAAEKDLRDKIVEGLEELSSKSGFDLESEVSRILPPLRPVEAPKPVKPKKGASKKKGDATPEPAPTPQPVVVDYAEKGRIAQKMGLDLQQAIVKLMAGPASPEEKMREATRMSEEYQAKIKALYNA